MSREEPRTEPTTKAGWGLVAQFRRDEPVTVSPDAVRRWVCAAEVEARQQGRDREPPPEIDVERLAVAIEQGFKGRWFEHDIVPGDLPYIAAAIAAEYERLSRGPQVRGGG